MHERVAVFAKESIPYKDIELNTSMQVVAVRVPLGTTNIVCSI